MAVDRSIVDINTFAVGRVHKLITILYMSWILRQGAQKQEFRDRELDGFFLPGTQMPLGIEHKVSANQFFFLFARRGVVVCFGAPHQGSDPLNQQPLRKGLLDIVVGAHPEAEQLIDLVILRGQEYDRQLTRLPQILQQLHAVHARHLDVENGQVHRLLIDPPQCFLTVLIGADAITLGLQRDGNRRQDILVVIDQCNRAAHGTSFFASRYFATRIFPK